LTLLRQSAIVLQLAAEQQTLCGFFSLLSFLRRYLLAIFCRRQYGPIGGAQKLVDMPRFRMDAIEHTDTAFLLVTDTHLQGGNFLQLFYPNVK
jgi:hypothetical protein